MNRTHIKYAGNVTRPSKKLRPDVGMVMARASIDLHNANLRRARKLVDALRQIELWAEHAMCQLNDQDSNGRTARKYLDKIGAKASKATSLKATNITCRALNNSR